MIRLQIWPVALYLQLVIFLFNGTKAANILGVFPMGAKSHFAFDLSIMKSLHAAGHEITIIYPFEETEHVQNFTVISISSASTMESTTQGSIEDFVKLPLTTYLQTVLSLLEHYCDNFLTSKYVQDMLNSPKSKFDVLIMEYALFNCFSIIAEKFDIPIILTNPIQTATYIDTLFGNPIHPAAIPSGFSYIPQNMNILQRMENIAYYLCFKIMNEVMIVPKVDDNNRRIRDNYGITPKKKFSLLFQNSHPSLFARPLVQNVIEIGGIHLKPSKKLPQDTQKFMDESNAGVILLTFGSIARGSFLTSSTVTVLKEVFGQIPQRVIWKYEDTIEDLPENVMISDWVPQRDILAHKNVVAFITHCGQNGIYEAIYESVPLVMVPFYGDQLTNAAALEEREVGVVLDPLKLSKEAIKNALNLVINDTRYRENMKKLSHHFKDRPMTPQESVVYWTEYIIAHKGAPHLRSSFADMPPYQYFFLDVLLVVALTLFLLYTLVRLFRRFCFYKMVKYDKKKKQN